MQTEAEFIAQIHLFLARSGMSPTAFGMAAIKDPNFIGELREGRSPSLRVVRRVCEFMGTWKPEGKHAARRLD